MEFACELMDLCRGTQEVEAVLSEGTDQNDTNNRDPLARLKMAMEYEEKKVQTDKLAGFGLDKKSLMTSLIRYKFAMFYRKSEKIIASCHNSTCYVDTVRPTTGT